MSDVSYYNPLRFTVTPQGTIVGNDPYYAEPSIFDIYQNPPEILLPPNAPPSPNWYELPEDVSNAIQQQASQLFKETFEKMRNDPRLAGQSDAQLVEQAQNIANGFIEASIKNELTKLGSPPGEPPPPPSGPLDELQKQTGMEELGGQPDPMLPPYQPGEPPTLLPQDPALTGDASESPSPLGEVANQPVPNTGGVGTTTQEMIEQGTGQGFPEFDAPTATNTLTPGDIDIPGPFPTSDTPPAQTVDERSGEWHETFPGSGVWEPGPAGPAPTVPMPTPAPIGSEEPTPGPAPPTPGPGTDPTFGGEVVGPGGEGLFGAPSSGVLPEPTPTLPPIGSEEPTPGQDYTLADAINDALNLPPEMLPNQGFDPSFDPWQGPGPTQPFEPVDPTQSGWMPPPAPTMPEPVTPPPGPGPDVVGYDPGLGPLGPGGDVTDAGGMPPPPFVPPPGQIVDTEFGQLPANIDATTTGVGGLGEPGTNLGPPVTPFTGPSQHPQPSPDPFLPPDLGGPSDQGGYDPSQIPQTPSGPVDIDPTQGGYDPGQVPIWSDPGNVIPNPTAPADVTIGQPPKPPFYEPPPLGGGPIGEPLPWVKGDPLIQGEGPFSDEPIQGGGASEEPVVGGPIEIIGGADTDVLDDEEEPPPTEEPGGGFEPPPDTAPPPETEPPPPETPEEPALPSGEGGYWVGPAILADGSVGYYWQPNPWPAMGGGGAP